MKYKGFNNILLPYLITVHEIIYNIHKKAWQYIVNTAFKYLNPSHIPFSITFSNGVFF